MINDSKEFYKSFKDLYIASNRGSYTQDEFEMIFKNNQSRINFLNKIFKDIKTNNVDREFKEIFERKIDIIYKYINGETRVPPLEITKNFINDENKNTIVPTNSELIAFFKLIEKIKEIYDKTYKDSILKIELPDNSLNQNMIRLLQMQDKDLASLLGLLNEDNLLKDYFYSIVKKPQKYGLTDGERLVNWLISKEGKEEIKRINDMTIGFVKKDQKQYPHSYQKGVLKTGENTLRKFKERYEKETGLKFPIIKFSKWMTNLIKTYNFFNMENVNEMILDYSNEKDLILVHGDSKKILKEVDIFTDLYTDIFINFYNYSEDEIDYIAKENLLKYNINLNDKKLLDLLNMIKASKYLEGEGIRINYEYLDEIIKESIKEYLKREIHIIGFNTNFNEQTLVDERSVDVSYLNTSSLIDSATLVSDYYKNGRTFFLDKIIKEDQCGTSYIMISRPGEELAYLRKISMCEGENSKYNELKEECKKLKENYINYKKSESMR